MQLLIYVSLKGMINRSVTRKRCLFGLSSVIKAKNNKRILRDYAINPGNSSDERGFSLWIMVEVNDTCFFLKVFPQQTAGVRPLRDDHLGGRAKTEDAISLESTSWTERKDWIRTIGCTDLLYFSPQKRILLGSMSLLVSPPDLQQKRNIVQAKQWRWEIHHLLKQSVHACSSDSMDSFFFHQVFWGKMIPGNGMHPPALCCLFGDKTQQRRTIVKPQSRSLPPILTSP